MPGVKLPKTNDQWEQANLYFQQHLPYSNVEQTINLVESTLYEYFHTNFGAVPKHQYDELTEKYQNMSNRKLKKCLNEEKQKHPVYEKEIRFISKLLRSKFNKKPSFHQQPDHNVKYADNLWKYCKEHLTKEERTKPTFSENECYTYFKNKTANKHTHNCFDIPPWMETLTQPTVNFNLEAPTYADVTKVVNYMRSKALPCPHDQICVIVLKRCPIVRTMLWKIINHYWKTKTFSSPWKKGVTILAYKKGDQNNPENFRPLTLQPVMCKVFTAIIKNKIYKYHCDKNYADHSIQKGF